jgi:dipeptidyl aminopeptidase/acylaminoacyl peptidase
LTPKDSVLSVFKGAGATVVSHSSTTNAKVGLAVFNHGGPHSAEGYGFNFKQQDFAANRYFVLDTNFRRSTGYGDGFKWATWGAWGNKDGEDVLSGVDYVIKIIQSTRNVLERWVTPTAAS